MSLLEVSDLTAGYGKIAVLHQVSARVETQEIVAIVGPNGAGKSTLAKSIMQLLKRPSGQIIFDSIQCIGRKTSDLSRLGIAYVPQGANTFRDLTIEENLKVALNGAGESSLVADGLDLAYSRFPVLGNRRKQLAGTLSGGERQMLALSAAMSIEPTLLILDEPTTGLAPTIVRDLCASIALFRDHGTAVLWIVEENPLEILKHADRVYLMQGGVFRQEATADQMLSDQDLRELFFGLEEQPS